MSDSIPLWKRLSTAGNSISADAGTNDGSINRSLYDFEADCMTLQPDQSKHLFTCDLSSRATVRHCGCIDITRTNRAENRVVAATMVWYPCSDCSKIVWRATYEMDDMRVLTVERISDCAIRFILVHGKRARTGSRTDLAPEYLFYKQLIREYSKDRSLKSFLLPADDFYRHG